MMPAVGKTAPPFALPDQDGTMHYLHDYKTKWLVLYFYPKDDTPGCTTEACNFRDSIHALLKAGVEVMGISTDSIEMHKKFAAKYALPFPLLSDSAKVTVEDYGVWAAKKMYGKDYMGIVRTTFLIKPGNVIAKIYENVKPEGHATAILADIAAL